MKNEILEEVWRVRDEISAECGHDLKKLAAMLRRAEKHYSGRLVRLPVRKTKTRKGRGPRAKPVASN